MVGPYLVGAGGLAGLATAVYGWAKDVLGWVRLRKLKTAAAGGDVEAAKVVEAKATVDGLTKIEPEVKS